MHSFRVVTGSPAGVLSSRKLSTSEKVVIRETSSPIPLLPRDTANYLVQNCKGYSTIHIGWITALCGAFRKLYLFLLTTPLPTEATCLAREAKAACGSAPPLLLAGALSTLYVMALC